MARILSLALLLVWCDSGFSQNPPVKFGDIPMEDLQMVSYDKDSSAAAVFLLDYGEAIERFDAGRWATLLTINRQIRIKILKKEGLSWATASISLFHKGKIDESVSRLRASAYILENGKIVKTTLSNANVFREAFDQHYDIQKFTIPGVKVGSVIEYTYTTSSGFNLSFPDWQFQRTVPVRWSEYWALIPPAFVYEKYMQGYVPVKVYEVKRGAAGENAFHWISKDIPAFKQEPFMTNEKDYVSKINFQLTTFDSPGAFQEIMGSWDKLNERLLADEDFGKVISKSGFLKDKVTELTEAMTDPLQRLETIHSYVKQNMEWNKTRDIYSENLKKAVELKRGTSADINLMLASMLDKAGFDVDMVLLSTRDHGFIRKEYPASRQFNYVICSAKIGGKTLLLDATEKYLPLTYLPERCLNGQGLIISNKNSGWVDLAPKTKSKTITSADFELDEKGELKGKLTFTRDGYDAFKMRSEYNLKGEEEYVKFFLGSRAWHIEKTEFAYIKDLSKPVQEVHDMTINEHVTIAGDFIYLNPFVYSQTPNNPFKPETREFPVDFGSLSEKMYLCKIKLPEGFSVEELPSSKIFALPDNAARFTYNAVLVGNAISITSSLQINKSLFLPSVYPDLREFYSQVVAKQTEQIVLKRK